MQSDVAIITVNMNPATISDLLDSLAAQKNKSFHLFIIDYTPKPISLPHKLIEQKHATILHRTNKGYAYGVNEGVVEATRLGHKRYVVINDDTYVAGDFIEKVQKSFEAHPSTLIGGKIYYAPGYEYHKERYDKSDKGRVLWYAGGLVDKDHATTVHRGVDEVDGGQYDTEEPTEFITGCLMLFDSDALKQLGAWDESYFLYYEDADYGERAKKHDIPLLYDPSLVVWHKTSSSTGGSGSSLHVNYQRKNQIKWARKYMPKRTLLHLLKNYALGKLTGK